MKKNLLVFLLLITSSFMVFGKGLQEPNFKIAKDVFGTRVFIENRGQFDSQLGSDYKIYYVLDNGLEKIYFTNKGLVYELSKHFLLTERQIEAMEKHENPRLKESKIYRVNMTWLNSNASLSAVASEKQSHYITYGGPEFNSNTYKKLTYKNVYEHIDIEYTIPEDKEYGVKYNVILHPGADPAHIKIAYSGDASKLKKDEDGNILIKTPLNDIVEHAPESFYESDKSVIPSSFSLDKNVIGFNFPSGYLTNKTVVIDPWVTTIASLSTNNFAFDVDYDSNGSVYIYGGYSPFKIAHYTSGGVLLWTFAGIVVTPAWTSAPIIAQASNFAVNKFTGKCYIGQGYVNAGNKVIRIDAAGNYDNFVNTANNQFQEVWDMGFHCVTGDVFVLGGGTSSNISAVTINPTTAVINPSSFQPTVTSVAQDVVCHAIDDAGNIFVIYAGGQMNNKICAVNATFNGNLWVQQSGFVVFTEQGNKTQYLTPPSLNSNGFNALAVNANFLYYYDGLNLAAYNKGTGGLVASTTIPSQLLKKQGGIAVDDCNNLYLGGNGSILTYSFNGTAFNSMGSIPLGLGTSTSQYVYDLQISKQNKTLYVCGSGFVGTYSAINTLGCPTATSACFFSIQQDVIICAGQTVTLTAPNQSSMTNVSYSLQPGAVTNSSGTFVVAPTINTTYTLYTTGVNQMSVTTTNTSVATVTVYAQPAVAPTLTQTSCTSTVNAFNLNLTFNPVNPAPGYTITWSPVPNGITSFSQTSNTGGINPGVYNALVTTGAGCTASAVITIDSIPLPPVFSINPPGGNYLVSCSQPSLEITLSPAVFNYTTYNGSLAPVVGTSAIFTATNAVGIWTVFAVNPISQCVSTQTYVVNASFTAPSSTITPLFQNITCSITSVVTLTAYGSPSVNISHNWISPSGGTLTTNSYSTTFFPGGPDIYTHCLVDNYNGCSTCKTFTVTSSSNFPTFNVTSPQNYTLGCNTKSLATINIINANTTPPGGAVSYSIIGPPTSPIVAPGILSSNNSYTVTVPGTWTVITKDNLNLCETRVQLSVLQKTTAPNLSVVVPQQILSCYVPSVVLLGESTTPNVSYNWAFPSEVGNVTSNTITVMSNTAATTNTNLTTYTLTITDNNNTCISTSVVPMYQNLFKPKVVISGGTELTCNTSTLTLTNMSSSNVPPALYSGLNVIGLLWEGPSPQVPLQLSTTYVAVMPGTYTMTARDLNNGCEAVATKTILDSRNYPEINKPIAPAPFVLDCGVESRTITALFSTSLTTDFSYTWTAAPGASVSGEHSKVLTTNLIGSYQLDVINTRNGCQSVGFVEVVAGELVGDFVSEPESGYAPLNVTFNNKSASTTGTNNIVSNWSYGNGLSGASKSVADRPETIYELPGKYAVTMFVSSGSCLDTVVKYVEVEIPSDLKIPNIFSPNGDNINDVFFLKTSNLNEISIVIYDRWGHKVYQLDSTTGNIAWDGKNMLGKDSAEGVYNYVLKATGKDGKKYDRNGNITLVR